MSRIRTIKPQFFKHKELFDAEQESGMPLRIAFSGLWTVADREGLFKWKADEIKTDVLPYDPLNFNDVLECLRRYGFIIKYEKLGKTYGFIPSFRDHQVINPREAKSNIPLPDASVQLQVITITGNCNLGDAQSEEGKGREGNTYTRVCETLCLIFQKAYKLPDERLPAEANFYRDIDYHVDIITQIHKPDQAVDQIKAYVQYCKNTSRKLIGTVHKLSETILSSDWVKMLNPESRGPDNPFRDAEENRKNWTDSAWRKHYTPQINDNPEFRKHFGI